MRTMTRFARLSLIACLSASGGAGLAQAGDEVSIDWPWLAQGFVERFLPEDATGEAQSFDAALAHSFGRLDLGAIQVHCPVERLADRRWLSELQPALVGLCDFQAALARWMAPGSAAAEAAESDFAMLATWIEGWRSNDFKQLDEAPDKDLVGFLEPTPEVAAAAERQRKAFARGGELGLDLAGAPQLELVLAPARLDFMQTVAFLGRDDSEFRANNWQPGIDQWTQLWNGYGLVVAAEYAPWNGFDPKFQQKKPMSDIEPDGVAQLIVQQAALALLTIEAGTPEPVLPRRCLANALTIEARGALNVLDGERQITTSGATTRPYERFVPGGLSEGGVLPAIPAAPLDTIIESRWRKGHGKDYFVKPLAEGQAAGAKAAKKAKAERAKDKLAHFELRGDVAGEHVVSAPFLGAQANQKAYPPAAFLNDFREFFNSYQTAFLHWLRTASDEDPALRAERFAQYVELLTEPGAVEGDSLDQRIEDIYGLPLSAPDGETDSLEWRFLAWLADA